MTTEEQIVNDYTINKLGIEHLCSKYKLGKLKIKKILSDNNITLNKKGGQTQNRIEKEFTLTIDNKTVTCNICQKEFNDVENKSGSLTDHMKECYPDVEIPSSYIRRIYLKTEGTFWHLQYFSLKDKENKETLKCPRCEWETVDLRNLSGSLTKHITDEHFPTIEDFLVEHKDFEQYFNVHKINKEREEFLSNEENSVTCKICNEKMKYVNHQHLFHKHGITLDDYKVKYLGSKFLSEQTLQKLKDSYEVNLKLTCNNYQSKAEVEISELIKSFGLEVLNNNKKILAGTEMDIYVPEKNIAFEYNGIFFHTEERGKGKWFHLNKQKLAKERGITLYHIFEDEWLFSKEIVKKKIIHILGKNNQPKIYGRKVVVKSVNKDELFKFLNINHIQGSAPKTSINLGAYYEDKLIGVMSFLIRSEKNKKNNNKEKYWELLRYATDINYQCVGVADKLFKYFIRQQPINTRVISFADRRWTPNDDNNLYTNLGFTLGKTWNPEYRYLNGGIERNKRIHKFRFRKKILLRDYPELLNEEMTESQMTKIIGCTKIWDCGLFRYEFVIK